MGGWCGRLLRVDLTRGSVRVEGLEEKVLRRFLGGRGLATYLLWREVPGGADPLGPENVLVFAPGVLTGVPAPGCGRNGVAALSPLTGRLGSAEAGGFWGAQLKRAGFDALVVEGRSPSPVYLWVHEGGAEIRDARHLWGLPTGEVESRLREELGDRIRVCQCGPAGEKLVRFSCVVNDLTHFAGRTGLGAVMGSKRLRAIAVRGDKPVGVADEAAFRRLVREMGTTWRESARGLHEHGTAGGTAALSAQGGLPTRNFREGSFAQVEKIDGRTMTATLLKGRESCFACPIRCKRVVAAEAPYRIDGRYGGPEYETVAALGSTCGVDDLAAVCKANEICAAQGLDTISSGVTVAFAMEGAERGVWEGWPDARVPRFGDAAGMVDLVGRIAAREGIGDLLAEGTLRAARFLGRGSEAWAVQVKGQEVPMHEPRLKHALGLGYAVSPTGADHCHNLHDTAWVKDGSSSVRDAAVLGLTGPLPLHDLGPDKVRLFAYVTNWRHFQESAVVCYFVPWTYHQLVELVRAVTGWNTSLFELLKVGERVATLARLFNIKQGWTCDEDDLHPRFYEPFAEGPLRGISVPRDELLRARRLYYGMMGWDPETGVPTEAKLAELGL
ncbi:MAG: aldehyde ferredoxin oxidoreductase family protein [Bacillota bacterium]